jgi:hypothetical protein
MVVSSRRELLLYLAYIAEAMEQLYAKAAKNQADIRGGIRKLEKRLNKL